MPPTTSNLASKSYAATRFRVSIDDHDITAFVKNVEGGMIKSDPVEEKAGAAHIPLKHTSTRSIEPISLEVGMCKANWLLDRIQEMINSRKHVRYSGQIDYADPNDKARFTHQFTRALISEVTFPAFDAAKAEYAFLKVKMQPESAQFEPGDGNPIKNDPYSAQKIWQTSAFRFDLEINGKALSTDHVTKVESFTIKVGNKVVPQGGRQLPAYLPTTVTIPKMSIHVPLHYADSILDWYRKSIANVQASNKDGAKASGGYEATGSLTVLDPSRKKELYRIDLDGVGPEQITMVKSEGGNTNMKSIKLDLYVTSMKLINVK